MLKGEIVYMMLLVWIDSILHAKQIILKYFIYQKVLRNSWPNAFFNISIPMFGDENIDFKKRVVLKTFSLISFLPFCIVKK